MTGPGRQGEVDAALQRLSAVMVRRATDRIEARVPHLVEVLHDAGIMVLVLKGPTTRLRLYGPDEQRPTADIDLLVHPATFRRATRVLRGEGYCRVGRHGHSDTLRAAGGSLPDVDLHLTLPYVSTRPSAAFATLIAHRTTLCVAGADIPVLDVPAHVVHLAIHAAVNRFDPNDRTFDEWSRAFAWIDEQDRSVASEVARALGVSGVWDLATRALSASALQEDLVGDLPLWEIEPRFASLRRARRSGIPMEVRWRDTQRMFALQLSDDAVNKWRMNRGIGPVVPGTCAAAASKTRRLFAVSCQGLRRSVGGRIYEP